jgi:hypothetical protein
VGWSFFDLALRKPRPLGLRFRVVLTEVETERLEWQML